MNDWDLTWVRVGDIFFICEMKIIHVIITTCRELLQPQNNHNPNLRYNFISTIYLAHARNILIMLRSLNSIVLRLP